MGTDHLMRQKMPLTKLRAGLGSSYLMSFDVQPDDIIQLWLECMVTNGIRRARPNDCSGSSERIVPILRRIKALGIESVGTVVYTHSPVHTDDFYANKTKELIDCAGVDVMQIKDLRG